MTAPTPNAPTGERTFRTRECMQCGGTMFWGFTAAVDGLPCWTCIYCMSAALLAARRELADYEGQAEVTELFVRRCARLEEERGDYAKLVEVAKDVNTSLRLLPLTGIGDAQGIYDTMYKILDRLARWLIDTPDYPGRAALREVRAALAATPEEKND